MGMWKTIRKNYRRLIASLLTMAMVITNAGGNLGTIFAAGETENALFLVDGKDLQEAIREAREQGEVFAFSELRLAAKRKSIKTRYEKLLGKKEGAVYALNLEIDDSYAPEGTELQVFYNAGTEDVIFLFLNGSDLVVDYRVNIDGYETEPVRVNPNTANIEAEGEEVPSYAENYEAADMIDDEAKKLEAEVLNPEETSEAGSETEAAEDKEQGDDSEQKDDDAEEKPSTEETEETAASDDSDGNGSGEAGQEKPEEKEESQEEPEAGEAEETEEESASEAGEETQEENEAEPETEPAEAAEPEASEEESEAEEVEEELLSLSRHVAAVVTISVDELESEEAEIEEETAASEEEAEEETEEETTAPEEGEEGKIESGEAKAEKDESSETKAEGEGSEETKTEETKTGETESGEAEAGKETEAEKETEAGKETGSEDQTESGSETEGKTDSESDNITEEPDADSETGTEAGNRPEESITGGEAGEETEAEGSEGSSSSAIPDEDSDGSSKGDAIDMDGQLLEDDEIEILGELKGKEYDTVTILDHVNARAFKLEWEDIEKILASDEAEAEYAVSYEVNLPEGAKVKGENRVAEGEDLYFAVEPEEGYEILAVRINGAEAEETEEGSDLASASDWEGYGHTYVVENVTEELSVEIEVEETEIVIPERVYEAETEDAVFTVNVPGDAFEEEVEFRAEKILDEDVLEDLTGQAEEAVGEGQAVAGILAYDLAFFTTSDEEVEPGKPVNVSISFKEPAITGEMAEEASGISVMHFPEGEEAKTVKEVSDTDVEELAFEAESFSPWAAVVTKSVEISHEGWIEAKNLKELHTALINPPAAGETKKIYLSSDIVTYNNGNIQDGDYGWAIPAGKDFVIDLNGHTLTYGGSGSSNHRLFYVWGTLTVMDSIGTGVIDSNRDVESMIYVDNPGTLNLEGGTIRPGEGCTSEYGVRVNGWNAVLNVNGASIENHGTVNTDGGGIYLDKGIVNINNGSIKGNTAKNGGGIYAVKGNVKVYGGSIEGNNAADGGGIYLLGGFHEVTGGEIKGNTAANNGGGIYICPDASAEVTGDAKIISNYSDKAEPSVHEDEVGYYAGSGGGGIFSNGKLTISGGEISGNEAVADGGGVYVDYRDGYKEKADFLMTGGVIDGNKAGAKFGPGEENKKKGGEGGGIYFGWDGIIEGGSITNNETQTAFDWGGGGIFIQTGVTVKMTNVLVTDNTAEGFGGGVAGCPSGHVKIFTVNGAAIYDNQANGTGMTERTEEDHKTQDKEAQADPIFMQDGLYQDYYCQNESIVYGKMLGGGSANWKGSSKQSEGTETEAITIDRYECKTASYRMGLKAFPDDSGKAYAESRARVRITGNTSTTHGGGIMCNGYLDLGEKGPGYFGVSKTVLGSKEAQEKEWGFTLFLSDSEGNPLTGETGASDSIIAFALKTQQSEGKEATTEYGTLTLEDGTVKFALKHGQTILFDDLPAGTVYHVVEDAANEDGYITTVSGSEDTIAIEDENDATKVIGAEGTIRAPGTESQSSGTSLWQEKSQVDFVNMQLSDLSVSKKVVGKTDGESWTFVLILLDEDGKLVKGLPNPLASAEKVNTVAFTRYTDGKESEEAEEGRLPIDGENGEIRFVLKKDQTITFKGIPAGTRYQIQEEGAAETGFEIRVIGNTGSKEIWDPEDPTRIIGIEGTVTPDKETGNMAAVQFINARLGSLAVTKTVIGDEKAKNDEWEFELKLHRDPDSPSFAELRGEWELDGEMQQEVLPYEISVNGTVVDTGSLAWKDPQGAEDEEKIRFALKHGQTITIRDIPVGSVYEVSEVKANEEGFITSVVGNVEADPITDEEQRIKGIKGAIADRQTAKASFVNTKTNILTVSKTVKGNEAFHDYEWSFTLQLLDENGNSFGVSKDTSEGLDAGMQAPVVAYQGGSMIAGVEAPQNGSVSLEQGKARFRLKHGQFLTFVDLPVGTRYTVTEDEANTQGLYAEVKGSEGSTVTENADGVSGTITDSQAAKVDFVNQSGKLTVRKIISGNQADPQKEFSFTVTLEDKSIHGQYGDMNFVNGVAELKLKGGESATAEGLPVSVGYVVEEHDNADYVVEASNASGEITVDGVLVTFINTKNENPPSTPDRPHHPGGGGGNPGGGGNTPGGPGATTPIEDPGVPLASLPPDSFTETIVESEVPLAALPKTGDSRHTRVLMMMFGIAGLGMLLTAAGLRRRKDESGQ